MIYIPTETKSTFLAECDWSEMSWTQRRTLLEDLGLLQDEYITNVGNAFAYSGEAVDGTYDGARNAAGEKEGFGTFRFANGDVYEGEWKAGQREGRGTFRFADSAVYEGEYKADKKEGRGTYRYADGAVYEGEWKAGMMESRGNNFCRA